MEKSVTREQRLMKKCPACGKVVHIDLRRLEDHPDLTVLCPRCTSIVFCASLERYER